MRRSQTPQIDQNNVRLLDEKDEGVCEDSGEHEMHHQESEGPQGEIHTPRPAGIPIKRQAISFLLRGISRQTIRVVDSDAVVVSHRVDPGVDSIHSWDRLHDDVLGGPAYPLEEVKMV